MIIKKEDLVTLLAEKADISKKSARENIELLMDIVGDALANGNAVELHNFAKIEVVQRAEREGINPATKEKLIIPARKTIKFTAKKGLKDRV